MWPHFSCTYHNRNRPNQRLYFIFEIQYFKNLYYFTVFTFLQYLFMYFIFERSVLQPYEDYSLCIDISHILTSHYYIIFRSRNKQIFMSDTM